MRTERINGTEIRINVQNARTSNIFPATIEIKTHVMEKNQQKICQPVFALTIVTCAFYHRPLAPPNGRTPQGFGLTAQGL